MPVATYEQIATILTKLATNYSNLSSIFYDVFVIYIIRYNLATDNPIHILCIN